MLRTIVAKPAARCAKAVLQNKRCFTQHLHNATTATPRTTPTAQQHTTNNAKMTAFATTTLAASSWATAASITNISEPTKTTTEAPANIPKNIMEADPEQESTLFHGDHTPEIFKTRSRVLKEADRFATWVQVLLNEQVPFLSNEKVLRKNGDEEGDEEPKVQTLDSPKDVVVDVSEMEVVKNKPLSQKLKKKVLAEKDLLQKYLSRFYLDPMTYQWCKDYLDFVFMYSNGELMEHPAQVKIHNPLPPLEIEHLTGADVKAFPVYEENVFKDLLHMKQMVEKERYKVIRQYESLHHLSVQMLAKLTSMNHHLYQLNPPTPEFFNQRFISPQMGPIYSALSDTILSLCDVEKCFEPALLLLTHNFDRGVNASILAAQQLPQPDPELTLHDQKTAVLAKQKRYFSAKSLLQQQLFCTTALSGEMNRMLGELMTLFAQCGEFYENERVLLFMQLAEMESKPEKRGEIDELCANLKDIMDFDNYTAHALLTKEEEAAGVTPHYKTLVRPVLNINPLEYSRRIINHYSESTHELNKYTATKRKMANEALSDEELAEQREREAKLFHIISPGYLSHEKQSEANHGIFLPPLSPLERYQRAVYNQEQNNAMYHYNINGPLKFEGEKRADQLANELKKYNDERKQNQKKQYTQQQQAVVQQQQNL